MGLIKIFSNSIDRIVRNINIVSMTLFYIIMVIGVLGVVFRFFGKPISGITNLSELLLVIAIYLSVAYAQQKKQHVAMTLLISFLSEKKRYFLNLTNLIIAMFLIGITQIFCWSYAIFSCRINEKMDGVPFYPIYPVKIAVAIGISFLWIQIIADLLHAIRND